MTEQTAKTTERSLLLVDTIQRLGGATLDELTTELEMARSTVHIHLTTLIKKGYICKEGEVYQVGLRFLNHGEYARTRNTAYARAKDTVMELSDQIDEEIEFVVENDNRGILVHESFHPNSQIPSKERHISYASSSAGIYYHLHCVATGKAILAELPDERIEEVIETWGLPAQTAQTITNKDALFEEIKQIRNSGLAFADEEYVEGLREVGRRVKSPTGEVLGAIAIIGPKYRFTSDRFNKELPDLLTKHIKNLESEIENTYLDNYR